MKTLRDTPSGFRKPKEFIIEEFKKLNVNDFNNNVAWALCHLQNKFKISTVCMCSVLKEFGVNRTTFFNARKKLRKGGIPGGPKVPYLNTTQWTNVKRKIINNYYKGDKIKVKNVSAMVCHFFFLLVLFFKDAGGV
jgi:hypothetical protein